MYTDDHLRELIKDLETDFGNDDVTRRAYAVDGKKWQATEQQPRTESRTGSRADHSHPNRLAMSLSGYGGKDQDVPCKLAQNTKQILMDLEQVSGWNGLWRGQCALKDSCVQAERGKDCIFDESYAAANSPERRLSGGTNRDRSVGDPPKPRSELGNPKPPVVTVSSDRFTVIGRT